MEGVISWGRRRPERGSGSTRTPGVPSPSRGAAPVVPAVEVEAALEALRSLLAREADRLRPDALLVARRLVQRSEALLPSWETVAAVRGAEALALHDVLSGALPRVLSVFLALPDLDKPAHADELLRQVAALEQRGERASARLVAVLTARLGAEGELH